MTEEVLEKRDWPGLARMDLRPEDDLSWPSANVKDDLVHPQWFMTMSLRRLWLTMLVYEQARLCE